MKLELVRGCVCDSLNIDGTEEIDLTDKQRQEVLDRIFKVLKPEHLNMLLQDLIEEHGEYSHSDEPCEQCGDYIDTWVWEI